MNCYDMKACFIIETPGTLYRATANTTPYDYNPVGQGVGQSRDQKPYPSGQTQTKTVRDLRGTQSGHSAPGLQ